MPSDWVIVGAGFTGATLAERIATQLDQTVTVIDRRSQVGGNAFDYVDDHGILLHKYGPHIFHTNSKLVWDYLSSFTKWRPYFHKVLASVDGQYVPVPFNYNSMRALFPDSLAESIMSSLIAEYGFGANVPILKLRGGKNSALGFVSEYVYEKIFLNYTKKQWGMTPEMLDPGVTARVPIRVSRDDRYFQDTYQAMPADGYTAMFRRMLDHRNIRISLDTEWAHCADECKGGKVIFTGPIDEYFNFRCGRLPYRSLRFDYVNLKQQLFQSTGTVNYPNEFDFTRVTEQKYLSGQPETTSTTLIYEYPEEWKPGQNEPYYPVPRAENRSLLAEYDMMARDLRGRVFFAGRLADYQYYNMDQAVARALTLFNKEIVGCGRKS